MKIIVLSKTDYKEKDVIINAISENGPISFKVRSGQVPGSAFYWVNNPLCIAEVEYVENVRYIHQILKGASLLFSPLNSDSSLDRLLSINLVIEVMNKMLPEEEKHLLFHEIEQYLTVTKELKNFYFTELMFLAKAIKAAGSEPEVNRCVFCGNIHDIVAFSFAEGGFICRNCVSEDVIYDLTPTQMKIVRYLFNVEGFENADSDKLAKEDLKAIFVKFKEFIYDGIGVSLDTIDHILKDF